MSRGDARYNCRHFNGLQSCVLFDCRLTGAWARHPRGRPGRRVNLNRVFFQYQPPRPLEEIDAELAEVEKRIMALLREVTE